ncbi:MAG: LemA family protein [Candidatus Omnitrophota bacterium]|nr:MAG: LemA family protein [Candidatus Omnitrophota bacterium]
MKKWLIVLITIGVVLVIFAGWFISGWNKVIVLDQKVSEGWAQVENQLQRRIDLIPNLVRTVKGYASHEKELFTRVTELRSQWAKAQTRGEKIKAAEGLGGALSRLLLVAESYPDLKASQNFLTLQAQLEGTENRIAVERNRYNRDVRAYNIYVKNIPGVIFASLRGKKPAEFFEAEAAAKAVPKVEF